MSRRATIPVIDVVRNSFCLLLIVTQHRRCDSVYDSDLDGCIQDMLGSRPVVLLNISSIEVLQVQNEKYDTEKSCRKRDYKTSRRHTG